jgi:hypothetical protein
MPSESKIQRLIIELTKATVEKQVEWDFDVPPSSLADGNYSISEYFQAEYKGQWIGLFERKGRAFDADREVYYWVASIILVFVGEGGRILFEYDRESSALNNLYRVVKESASDIDNILDTLLQ